MMRFLRSILAAVLIPLGFYLLAAVVLGRMPVNDQWRESRSGVTIFVQSNGVHTGVVLPAGPGRWQAYGWGDRDFYMNTPRWQDIRPGTALSALVGSGTTLIHVDDLGNFRADENWRPLRLRRAEFARLKAYVEGSIQPGANALPGYGPNDRFYPARGHYSAITTCNVWTGNALRAAGIRVGRWTPFSADVMRWVPDPTQTARPTAGTP